MRALNWIVCASVLAAGGVAFAGPVFDEPPGDDAGSSKDDATDVKSPTGGQVSLVRGSLDGSTGLLGGTGDWQDVYRIYITDPGIFRAETLGLNGDGALRDSMLYLFDESGRGIMANNNINGDLLMSKLVNENNNGEPIFTAPGFYFLAVTSALSEPTVNLSGDKIVPLFEMGLQGNETGIVQPRSTWENLLWSDGWTDVTDYENFGLYEIALTGVGSVPAPGALALLALGFRARRRR